MRRAALVLLAVLAFPAAASASAWNRPKLVNPVTIDLSATAASTYHDSYRLDGSRDYVLKCPSNPVVMPNWLEVVGGHNVVIAHCRFRTQGRALKLLDTQGTVWVHDVHFEAMDGAVLTEGIDVDEPDSPAGGATVVLRDVLIDELHGSYTSNHADCVQSWRGPRRFLIDGLGCLSDYQGLFLLPNQFDSSSMPTAWDFRHVELRVGATALWLGNLTEPSVRTWNVQSVYATPLSTWNGTSQPDAWAAAREGPAPDGPYVTAVQGGAVGVDNSTSIPALTPDER